MVRNGDADPVKFALASNSGIAPFLNIAEPCEQHAEHNIPTGTIKNGLSVRMQKPIKQVQKNRRTTNVVGYSAMIRKRIICTTTPSPIMNIPKDCNITEAYSVFEISSVAGKLGAMISPIPPNHRYTAR